MTGATLRDAAIAHMRSLVARSIGGVPLHSDLRALHRRLAREFGVEEAEISAVLEEVGHG